MTSESLIWLVSSTKVRKGQANGGRVVVLTAAKKGPYLVIGNHDRTSWEQHGPYLTTRSVNHARFDPRDGSIWTTANDGTPGLCAASISVSPGRPRASRLAVIPSGVSNPGVPKS